MTIKRTSRTRIALEKRATGIAGFDEITGGGVPDGRATIVIGAAGTGKTVFSLQSLANAVAGGERGIFVAFEEEAENILLNAATFGWNLPALLDNGLHIFNANIPPDAVHAGDFDLGGLLAAVGESARKAKATWVVFDAIDVLLSLLESSQARRRELFRIQAWLKTHRLTCIITLKEDPEGVAGAVARESVSYIADCVVHLQQSTAASVSSRSIRILKYRGSPHSANSVPYWIGPAGMEVDTPRSDTEDYPIFSERIGTGIERLDTMLGAGLFRSSTTLLTGTPGTSKTTLSGKFAEAACLRQEQTLYVCLDESPHELVRNLKSVAIDLSPHIASGMLHMHGTNARQRSADSLYAEIRGLLDAIVPQCVIIDPVSSLNAVGNESEVLNTIHRIIRQFKTRGITSYLTSVVSNGALEIENPFTHVSTLADNWIHVSYLVRAGERNRALTIVKARGTGHSNQVRELILSSSGVTLTDVFTEGGEVLMGSMRAQKEGSMAQARESARSDLARRVHELESGAAQLDENIIQMQRELSERREQLQILQRENVAAEHWRIERREALAQSRGADVPVAEESELPPASVRPRRKRA